jgi:SNF2 family DNA or RNA helicase
MSYCSSIDLFSQQFVVVCPSSLVVNWANEFDKWLGRASQPKRVVVREGGADGLQQIRTYVQRTIQQIKHQPGQVLIVSYDLFRRNSSVLVFPECVSIGLLVVDEGHRLKNAGDSVTFAALESLPSDGRLCITATPIQNNLSEFFNLANFCCPGILGPDIAYFRKYYERPIVAANQKNASHIQRVEGSIRSKELETISKLFMMRRLQKDILTTMLPPRTEVLLFCRPSKLQCQLYQSVCKTTVLSNMNEALTTLITLRKICSHPSLLDKKHTIAATHPFGATDLALSGKLVVLNDLLLQIRRHAPHDKVVIVSNFTSALSIIESLVLQPHSHSYLRLDGSTKNRQALVDTFNRTSVEHSYCLLLSSKAGGCGLNIVGANRLFMFGKTTSDIVNYVFFYLTHFYCDFIVSFQTPIGIQQHVNKPWDEFIDKAKLSHVLFIVCLLQVQSKRSSTNVSHRKVALQL